MSIDIINESGTEPDVADLRRLAEFLLSELGMAQSVDLSIALVDEQAMTTLHEQWLDEPGPTDVISIPMDELREPKPGDLPVVGVLGDVVICPTVAVRQAAEAGHRAVDEFRVLLTHGVLHLLGNDHVSSEEARAMFSQQNELIARFRRQLGE